MSIKQLIILIIAGIIIWLLLYRRKNDTVNSGMNKQALKNALENSTLYRTTVAKTIFDCVRANYHSCDLECPVNVINHLAPSGYGVKIDIHGRIWFRYIFRRSSMCPSGGIIQYSTVPMSTILGCLNPSFGNYCIQYGLLQRYIVGKDMNNGQVCFAVPMFKGLNDTIIYLNTGYVI